VPVRSEAEKRWLSRQCLCRFGVVGFDGQIELEALRFYGLPRDALPISFECSSLPTETHILAMGNHMGPAEPGRRRDGKH
jgi:hypothetical protein